MSQPDDYRTPDARLILLQHLAAENDYTAHEHILREALRRLGHGVSSDWLRTQLAWLDEQDLIVLSGQMLKVARLTARGDDVARGLSSVPGVARPRPQ